MDKLFFANKYHDVLLERKLFPIFQTKKSTYNEAFFQNG